MASSGYGAIPELAGKITADQVRVAGETVARLAEELRVENSALRDVRRQIAKINRRIKIYKAITFSFRLVFKIRATAEQLGVWLGGTLIIGTAISGALALVLTLLLTKNATALTLAFAVGSLAGGSAIVAVLFLPGRYFRPPNPLQLHHSLVAAELRKSEIDKACTVLSKRHVDAVTVYERLREIVESRLHRLLTCDWRMLRGIPFEEFLADVFRELGFEVELTKASGDQGVDLIVKRQNFRLAVQAKGYSESVGNGAVQEVVAGMIFYRCDACAVITNSAFTTGAIALAAQTNCMLIDGTQIQRLIRGQIKLC